MPCMPVDGMSCEAVHKAMDEAVDRARRGDGPTFLEIRTYRFRGHSMSDPQKYRTKEEVEEYKKQDPIEVVRDTIIKKKWAKTTDLEAIEAEMKKVVEAAEQFVVHRQLHPGRLPLHHGLKIQPFLLTLQFNS
jgi:pyruvate dehydrogenase E1 component alpha subunit